MPLNAEQIRELIRQKMSEIVANKVNVCVECGEQLPPEKSACDSCEKVAVLNQLRNLAAVDPSFATLLAEVEAEENK